MTFKYASWLPAGDAQESTANTEELTLKMWVLVGSVLSD